jgi:hypothetical protein
METPMMKQLRWIALALPFALLAACAADAIPDTDLPSDEAQQSVTTTGFTASYTGQGANASRCNTSFAITGQEPTTSGTFPVFLYMVGTTETSTNASATAAVAGMASRGFVAATIGYDAGSFNNCTGIKGKASCMFDAGSSSSAVSVLCARAKADCSKGIVVGGFSQGAVIATQAKNFDARVRAAWGIGDGVQYTTAFNLSSCQANGNHTLDSNHLRAVVGQKDQFVGNGAFGIGAGTAAAARTQLMSLTGLTCSSTTFNCLRSDGSGWYLVQNSQVQDGSADHCHMRASGDCSGSQDSLDAGWANGSDPWELAANLDWLNGFVTH